MLRPALTQPRSIAIGEVRVAFAAAGIGAVALGTIVHEQPLANGQSARIFRKRWNTLGRELRIQRRYLGLHLTHILLMFGFRRPLGEALEAAQAWINHQITERKNDCNDEQPHPPARQRVVQLTQILIPDMACRVVIDLPGLWCCNLGFASQPQQQCAGQYGQQTDDRYIKRPKAIVEIAHAQGPYSDLKGSWAASSN